EPGKEALEKPSDDAGRFEATLLLDLKTRGVELRAGAGERETAVTIPVEIDPDPPSVKLEAPTSWREGPLALALPANGRHVVSGRFELLDGDGRSLATSPASIENGRARATLDVPSGLEKLRARAYVEDALGRHGEADREIAVDRSSPTPPPQPEPTASL